MSANQTREQQSIYPTSPLSLGKFLLLPVLVFRKLRYIAKTSLRPSPYEKPPRATNPEFLSLLQQVESRSMQEHDSIYNLYQFAKLAKTLLGDVAEVGVFRGGTAKMLSKIFNGDGKRIHLFDTFEGMPETDAVHDKHRAGDFHDTSIRSVKSYIDANNVDFHAGRFPDTTGPVSDCRFCFVHFDADLYQATLDACEFFYPRLVPGGVMIFHDYRTKTCPGMSKAVQEYFADHLEKVLFLPPNQCLVIKL